MSQWGTLEAEFKRHNGSKMLSVEGVRGRPDWQPLPTGSESGPDVYERDGSVRVSGRLRDVFDHEDSFAVLDWFVKNARWSESARLLWEIDNGPRYRYEWADGELRRLRGVLDA